MRLHLRERDCVAAAGWLPAEQISVVAEPVSKATKAVGVTGADTATKVEDRVPQFNDRVEVELQYLPRLIENGIESRPVVGVEDDMSVLGKRKVLEFPHLAAAGLEPCGLRHLADCEGDHLGSGGRNIGGKVALDKALQSFCGP